MASILFGSTPPNWSVESLLSQLDNFFLFLFYCLLPFLSWSHRAVLVPDGTRCNYLINRFALSTIATTIVAAVSTEEIIHTYIYTHFFIYEIYWAVMLKNLLVVNIWIARAASVWVRKLTKFPEQLNKRFVDFASGYW